MAVPLLDLKAQYESIREEIDAAIARVVGSQRFILGPEVEALESAIAERVGAPHAVGCASGTDALLLALKALELEPGDEVIVPSFTFFATAGAVWNAGLKPVFVDVDPRTFNMTAETIARGLTGRTRAVVVVHLFGQMADMSPILALAAERELTVIEDAAQAIGAGQDIAGVVREAGAEGPLGCFSFFPSKNLGAYGDGGLVTSTDEGLAERVRKLRVHGGKKMYHHDMVGTNSRLDALQAAVLLAKLPHLDRWTEARQAHARAYDERLSRIRAVRTPSVLPHNRHVYNQYTIRAEDRDGLRDHLSARGIGSAVYYPVPLHLQACFAGLGCAEGDLPMSEAASREVLSLPVFPELTEAQQDEVCAAVESFYS